MFKAFPPKILTATIVTLPKPVKEPNAPQNIRPILLLNVDVKLYANRLAKLLPKQINNDQVGFVNGHQGTDATRRMISLIHLVEKSGGPSLLLTLDAEKAIEYIVGIFSAGEIWSNPKSYICLIFISLCICYYRRHVFQMKGLPLIYTNLRPNYGTPGGEN